MSIEVSITGKEYRRVAELATDMWCSKKKQKNAYNDGILNSQKDPTKTERCGCLGEACLGILLGIPDNLGYKEGGDKYDFLIHNQKIDIKSATKKRKIGYITKCPGHQNFQYTILDGYVFGWILEDKPSNEIATIEFAYWATKDQVLNSTVKQSPVPRCSHINYEVDFKKCYSIEQFMDWVKSGHFPKTKRTRTKGR